MPLNTKKNTGQARNKIELPDIDAGTYMGRISGVVDVGLQPQEDYTTKEAKPPKEEFHVIVEFPKLRVEVDGEDKPRWLSKKFRVSNKYNSDGSENPYYQNSAMAKWVEPLMTGDNVDSIVNLPVMCSIGHTSGGNPKITTLNKAPDEVNVPELENSTVVFDFYEPDVDAFESMPKWMQKCCLEAIDFEGSQLSTLLDVADS